MRIQIMAGALACFMGSTALAQATEVNLEVVNNQFFSIQRPTEYPASFEESDFDSKPWLKDFQIVVVVNKSTTGNDAQTVRIYRNQKLVTASDILAHGNSLNATDTDRKDRENRAHHLRDLPKRLKDETTFLVSSGRDAFEKKGENHGQKDSWTVTPSGYYTAQSLKERHQSESYSSKFCSGFIKKVAPAIARKVCTFMDYVTFFNKGIALHQAIPGTEGALGKKASGGCVRMPRAVAEYLYYEIGKTKAPGVLKIPVVQPDGTVQTDINGNTLMTDRTKSIWGDVPAWSVLVIVTNQVK